jgi:hypothetical protein
MSDWSEWLLDDAQSSQDPETWYAYRVRISNGQYLTRDENDYQKYHCEKQHFLTYVPTGSLKRFSFSLIKFAATAAISKRTLDSADYLYVLT